MAQHDYDIANQSGSAFRADLNNALAAIVSNNSGASAPSTTYAHQIWIDSSTSPATIKRRDASNASWITLGAVDGSIPLGSAAAPSLFFSGDTNTGVYSPGADQVAVAAGGTGKVFITSTGLGVNNASPGAQLSLQDATAPTVEFYAGATKRGLIKSTSSELNLNPLTGNDITFTMDASERFRFTSVGRLGIGNIAPAYSLDITGDQRVTNSAGNTLTINRTANPGSIAWQHSGTETGQIQAVSGGGLNFYTGSTPTFRATLNATGLGIGTSTPQHLLDCTSIGRFTGNTNSAASGAGIEIGYDSGNATGFIQSYNRGSSTYLSTAVDGSDVRLKISGAEKARLTASGQWLVGTSTAPSGGELLRVEKASTGTEGAGIRFGGSYTIADTGTQTITVGNGGLVFISDNTTGDGALFFCTYKTATVTLIADPNSRYANTVTAGKISLTKAANSLNVTLTNNSGASRGFTIGKINNSD